MKWLFLVVLLLGCAGYGFLFANEMRRRIELLQELRSSWKTLQTRIAFFTDPLQTAFQQSQALVSSHAKTLFVALGELVQKGCDMPVAMERSLREITKFDPIFGCLQQKDRQALLSFAERIGSDSNTQKAAFAFMDAYLNDEISAAQQRFQSHARLYRASGVLFGLMLVVLFW